VIAIYVALGVVVVLVVSVIASFNRFVRQRNLVQESWRQIDVELKRRHDLIPNLVETVKGYAAHERGVFDEVTQARTAAQQLLQSAAAGPAEQGPAENTLQQALGRLIAVAENYPQLKASQQFLALESQLSETEDRIAAGRRFYNGNVRSLNTRVEGFPSGLIASIFHFEKAQYFEVDDAATRSPVAVDFSTMSQTSPPPPSAPTA
jgi:LemA protein